MSKSEMASVRFPLALIAAARRFAGHDGVSVSEWIRRLVDREISKPRDWADVSEWPQAETVASGAPASVGFDVWPQPVSWTGPQ